MPSFDADLVAVLVAAVAAMIVGALWYGPIAGKQWMQAAGKTEEDIKDGASASMYVQTFVSALVIAWALAVVIGWSAVDSIGGGIAVGILAGVGFVATTAFSVSLFEGTNRSLWMINSLHSIVAFAVMGAIITLF